MLVRDIVCGSVLAFLRSLKNERIAKIGYPNFQTDEECQVFTI